jgi:hypothetical protein
MGLITVLMGILLRDTSVRREDQGRYGCQFGCRCQYLRRCQKALFSLPN